MAFLLFSYALQDLIPSLGIRFLITLPTMLFILSIIPGQYRLSVTEEKAELHQSKHKKKINKDM
jgi:hypothetical protein